MRTAAQDGEQGRLGISSAPPGIRSSDSLRPLYQARLSATC